MRKESVVLKSLLVVPLEEPDTRQSRMDATESNGDDALVEPMRYASFWIITLGMMSLKISQPYMQSRKTIKKSTYILEYL